MARPKRVGPRVLTVKWGSREGPGASVEAKDPEGAPDPASAIHTKQRATFCLKKWPVPMGAFGRQIEENRGLSYPTGHFFAGCQARVRSIDCLSFGELARTTASVPH